METRQETGDEDTTREIYAEELSAVIVTKVDMKKELAIDQFGENARHQTKQKK
jgi:hypothetical protein